MRSIFFDIETVPQSEARLLELMPSEISNPEMPAELQSMGEVDLTKCPAYSGDLGKQAAWREKTIREAKEKFQKSREDWQMKSADAKAKWMGDAALYAERGQLKIMSFRSETKTSCIIADCKAEEMLKIQEHSSWPCKVEFQFLKEGEALHAFTVHADMLGKVHKTKLVGYYIAGFDIPFLLRRQMLLGERVAKAFIKNPRYLDEDLFTDIRDCWIMGDKQMHTGGLDGLAQILGVKRKTGTGEGFWRIWRDDPVAAILYHLNEIQTIEEVAKRVGAVD